jgi:hypothetical protein
MDKRWFNFKTTPEEVAALEKVLDRATYRRFKQVDRQDMAVVLARIYHSGKVDGAQETREAIEAEAPVEIDWDMIMDEICKVKGVGRKLAERINAAVTGRFDNDSEL